MVVARGQKIDRPKWRTLFLREALEHAVIRVDYHRHRLPRRIRKEKKKKPGKIKGRVMVSRVGSGARLVLVLGCERCHLACVRIAKWMMLRAADVVRRRVKGRRSFSVRSGLYLVSGDGGRGAGGGNARCRAPPGVRLARSHRVADGVLKGKNKIIGNSRNSA